MGRENRKAFLIKDASGSKLPAAGKALAREMVSPALLKTADPMPAKVENPRDKHIGSNMVRSPVARSSQRIFADMVEKTDYCRPSSSAAEQPVRSSSSAAEPPAQEKSKLPGIQRQHSAPTDIFFCHSPTTEQTPVKIRTAPMGGGDRAAGEGLLAMIGRSSSDAALSNVSLEDGARQHEAALLRSEHAHIAHEIPHIGAMYTTPRGPRDRSPTCAAINAAGRGRSTKSSEDSNATTRTNSENVKIQVRPLCNSQTAPHSQHHSSFDDLSVQVTPQKVSSRAVKQHSNRSTIFNDQSQHRKPDQPVTWQVQDLTLSNLGSNISDKSLTSICQSFGHQVVHAKVEYDPLTHNPTGSARVRLRTSSSRLSSTTDLISHLEKQRWVI